MIIEINKDVSIADIRQLIDSMFIKKRIKGYPDLDRFFGILQPRNYTQIQKLMRDDWE